MGPGVALVENCMALTGLFEGCMPTPAGQQAALQSRHACTAGSVAWAAGHQTADDDDDDESQQGLCLKDVGRAG